MVAPRTEKPPPLPQGGPAKASKATAYPDRVKGLGWLPRARVEPAPANWRTHNDRQRAAFRGLAAEVGVAGAVLAWVPDDGARKKLRKVPAGDAVAFTAWLEGYAGKVQLVDGHMRREELKQTLAVLVTDLDEGEARKVLLTFDPVAAMAGRDDALLKELLGGVKTKETGLADLLDELRGSVGEAPEGGGGEEAPDRAAIWLIEVARVLKPGAPVCLFTDWRQLPATTDALQAGGLVWRGIVPWDKTEGCRPSMGRFASQCEYVVWGSNGAMPVDRDVGCLWGCFRESVKQDDKFHQTGKPTQLMRKINAICSPGGVILDIFFGSGSTGAAALLDGYRVIGCEKTEAYAPIARGRLAYVEAHLADAAAP